jgi:hypothetical protein
MHHKHPGNISLEPRSLELVLLPLRQQVIDRVLQLVMICAVVGGDCLLCSVSYCISVCCSESWTLVPTDHTRKISMIALYSYRPRHETLLILNSRGVVMSMQFRKSCSLSVGIRASFLVVFISSASWYIFSFSESLKGV